MGVLCAGASQWYVNTGASKAYEYLGMCESDTMMDLSGSYEGIGLDGAARGDYDRQLVNAVAGISGDLSYWNEPVLDKLKTLLNDPANNATPGTFANGTFGTLLRTEGKYFSLCIVSIFGGKQAYVAAGMHPCWVFPLVFPTPFRRNLSMRATRERIGFEAIVQSNGLGGGVLYSNVLPSGLPTPS